MQMSRPAAVDALLENMEESKEAQLVRKSTMDA